MDYTLNDFEYKFKFGGKLRQIICKHCGSRVKFTLARNAPLQDVQIHSAHTCVAHSIETAPVSNVGMYFNRFNSKVVSIPTMKAKSRYTALKSLFERLLKRK